jgi:hypothetical protein
MCADACVLCVNKECCAMVSDNTIAKLVVPNIFSRVFFHLT